MTTLVSERNNLAQAENPRLDPPLAALTMAAESGDGRALVKMVEAMNWTNRPAEDFIQAARLALTVGALITARAISAMGAEKYPYHAELQKYARILAAPHVIRRDLPSDPTMFADREWIKKSREQYRGQWVALRNGELLESASSLDELASLIQINPEIFVTKVF